jgi:hypothetical protein
VVYQRDPSFLWCKCASHFLCVTNRVPTVVLAWSVIQVRGVSPEGALTSSFFCCCRVLTQAGGSDSASLLSASKAVRLGWEVLGLEFRV